MVFGMYNKTLDQQLADKLNTEQFDRFRCIIRPKAKRLLDIMASITLFTVIFPLFLLIMLALICTGQSPFYSHVRIGRGGREFGCLKFRSMRRNANATLA